MAKRKIDQLVEKNYSKLGKKFTLIKKGKIKKLKAYILIAFAIGSVSAVIWGFSNKVYNGSDASGGPVPTNNTCVVNPTSITTSIKGVTSFTIASPSDVIISCGSGVISASYDWDNGEKINIVTPQSKSATTSYSADKDKVLNISGAYLETKRVRSGFKYKTITAPRPFSKLTYKFIKKIACISGQKIGDINGNGSIDSADLEIEKSYLSGAIPMPEVLFCADTDKNGRLDNSDLQKLNDAYSSKSGLGMVESLMVTAVSSDKIIINWPKSEKNDFVKYIIKRSDGDSWNANWVITDINTTSYTDSGLKPGTRYKYIVITDSAKSNTESNTTVATTSRKDSAKLAFKKKVAAVFIYSYNEKMPDENITAICGESSDKSSIKNVPAWYKREAAKYNVDFNLTIDCFKDQLALPESLWAMKDGFPVDQKGILDYVKTANPALADYDYIALNYYIPKDIVMYSFALADNFFMTTKKVEGGYYIPLIASDRRSKTLAHEFSHLLGAIDEYSTTPGIDCLIDPSTGYSYNGYDIMCSRIGGATPDFDKLMISRPTAIQLGWL